MPVIQLPNNWKPRGYQMKAWQYLQSGGRHAELIWHRRSGKDDISLNWTAIAAMTRVAPYWHMLPEKEQARKAIWNAVDPHTGIRRIDQAFPLAIRKRTLNQEMMIEFVNGSTWQVLGSDSYNSAVGSSPAGIVYSEWALANPSARAYFRPMIMENKGWQIFITTPRGKNHAYRTYNSAKANADSFAQIITVNDSKRFTPEELQQEMQSYIDDFGEDHGLALFQQEYLCSFDAAIMGAYFAREMQACAAEGRIRAVPMNPDYPLHTAWDLGYSDDTTIWFYQVIGRQIHIVDYLSTNGRDIDYYAEEVTSRMPIKDGKVKYGTMWLPHDAKAKTLASNGKSIEEQLAKHFGWGNIRIVPNLSIQDGIQAARKMLPMCHFDEENCGHGVEALSQYQREWDDRAKTFREQPKHDWTSHPADAFRMLAIAWQQEPTPKELVDPKFPVQLTIDEMIARQRKRRLNEEHR